MQFTVATMTREEGRAWFANVLLDQIRRDRYPSQTHMDMVEDALRTMPQLVPDYMDVLLEKVADEDHPSITMLSRIRRLADTLPPAPRS